MYYCLATGNLNRIRTVFQLSRERHIAKSVAKLVKDSFSHDFFGRVAGFVGRFNIDEIYHKIHQGSMLSSIWDSRGFIVGILFFIVSHTSL